jgi:hypothetical protein
MQVIYAYPYELADVVGNGRIVFVYINLDVSIQPNIQVAIASNSEVPLKIFFIFFIFL